jgi:hypothetical protein
MANRKSAAEMDSVNRRREADVKAKRAFGTLDSPMNFWEVGWIRTLTPGPHESAELYLQVRGQQGLSIFFAKAIRAFCTLSSPMNFEEMDGLGP